MKISHVQSRVYGNVKSECKDTANLLMGRESSVIGLFKYKYKAFFTLLICSYPRTKAILYFYASNCSYRINVANLSMFSDR